MDNQPRTLLQLLLFWKKRPDRCDDEASNIRAAAREELEAKAYAMERALIKLQPFTGLLTLEETPK